MCFLLFFSSVIDPIVKQRQGAGRCNDVGMIVFDNVLVQDDVQETFLRTSRLDQLQPFLAFIGYDIDQRLVAFTFRKVQPCSRFRTPSVASRTGTVEDFGLDAVEHTGVQISGVQPYSIRLFRIVGGIKTGDPFAQLVDDTNFDLCDLAGNTGQDHVYRPVVCLANPFCCLGESIVGSESGQHDAVTARPGIYPADFGGQLHRPSLSFRLIVFIIYLAVVTGDGKTGKEQQPGDE